MARRLERFDYNGDKEQSKLDRLLHKLKAEWQAKRR